MFSTGMQTRSELNKVHDREKEYLEKTAVEAVKKMEEKHAEVCMKRVSFANFIPIKWKQL